MQIRAYGSQRSPVLFVDMARILIGTAVSPVLGIKHLELDWFVPKTGLQYYLVEQTGFERRKPCRVQTLLRRTPCMYSLRRRLPGCPSPLRSYSRCQVVVCVLSIMSLWWCFAQRRRVSRKLQMSRLCRGTVYPFGIISSFS